MADSNSSPFSENSGTVLSLNLSVFTQYQISDDAEEDVVGDGPDIPDLSPYRAAMISDMRDLMSRLKQ
ncbi:hypothetical protein [Streptomyces sp. NPDC005181]|uniref:hypothetical protein n=1 Tax=Streptomyces sp. NPDC005181 TaxID=3156869 RepID=UPI0033B09830